MSQVTAYHVSSQFYEYEFVWYGEEDDAERELTGGRDILALSGFIGIIGTTSGICALSPKLTKPKHTALLKKLAVVHIELSSSSQASELAGQHLATVIEAAAVEFISSRGLRKSTVGFIYTPLAAGTTRSPAFELGFSPDGTGVVQIEVAPHIAQYTTQGRVRSMDQVFVTPLGRATVIGKSDEDAEAVADKWGRLGCTVAPGPVLAVSFMGQTLHVPRAVVLSVVGETVRRPTLEQGRVIIEAVVGLLEAIGAGKEALLVPRGEAEAEAKRAEPAPLMLGAASLLAGSDKGAICRKLGSDPDLTPLELMVKVTESRRPDYGDAEPTTPAVTRNRSPQRVPTAAELLKSTDILARAAAARQKRDDEVKAATPKVRARRAPVEPTIGDKPEDDGTQESAPEPAPTPTVRRTPAKPVVSSVDKALEAVRLAREQAKTQPKAKLATPKVNPKKAPVNPKLKPTVTPKSAIPAKSAITPKPVAITPKAVITPKTASITPKAAVITPKAAVITPKAVSITPKAATITPKVPPIALKPTPAPLKSALKSARTKPGETTPGTVRFAEPSTAEPAKTKEKTKEKEKKEKAGGETSDLTAAFMRGFKGGLATLVRGIGLDDAVGAHGLPT
ncbi:hypothetical protein J8273_5359 [Carpediemonas membranifera]|uniref:Uncharacterized protein n=1 Tax=Carpediemonas membranifera TaxID=201153 RepID=A0A8J6B3S4_9EUKA|nr:hypothetical protein J8273_5359 [Carpediemonas membranifera]|eukprot:KAG9392369.1 hypothetical protein J8273_5359 [Carpediemonas membranifera]